MKIIAHIKTDFPEKFGIPRQSGLVKELKGEIIFEPEYRVKEALKGIEEFSYLWLLWEFSEVAKLDKPWSPTVFPPRLGGKESRGVFATRSPFRPNPVGLSCVKLEEVILESADGPKLIVSGIDLLDGTPIYDIKPYLPYADAKNDANGGFGEAHARDSIKVSFADDLLKKIDESKREAIIKVLEQDPRAAYNKKPDYVYGMSFDKYDIRFVVNNEELKVVDVVIKNDTGYKKIKGC